MREAGSSGAPSGDVLPTVLPPRVHGGYVMRLLFITWDGPGTTYHETLFIPLLERSIARGDKVLILQFSWDADERGERLRDLASSKGMRFEHRRVHRGPAMWRLPFTMLAALGWLVRKARDGTYDTILARSMIPGALALCMGVLTHGRSRFIFDADGLSADERVEFGGWPSGGVRYRVFRWIERAAVRRADAVISRTSRAVSILRDRSGCPEEKFIVVTNGKDGEEFHPVSSARRAVIRDHLQLPEGAPLLVYVGSIGPQYEPGFMLQVLARCLKREAQTHLLVLTSQRNHATVGALVDHVMRDRVILHEATPSQVPELLASADAGLAFRRPTFSQRAVAPIKIAEYLLCGLPVAYTSGVGDLDQLLDDRVSIAVGSAEPAEAERVAEWFATEVLEGRERFAEAAREVGLRRFSLDAGAEGYRRAFALARSR